MTLDEFSQTLSTTTPPMVSPLLQSLWHDAKGDWDQAHRLAQDVSGADGAWVFPAFRPCFGTSAAEINKLF